MLAGQLAEGATQVRPIITGQGRSGPMQFRVSRVSQPDEEPERDNYVERLWAYLTVQVSVVAGLFVKVFVYLSFYLFVCLFMFFFYVLVVIH